MSKTTRSIVQIAERSKEMSKPPSEAQLLLNELEAVAKDLALHVRQLEEASQSFRSKPAAG